MKKILVLVISSLMMIAFLSSCSETTQTKDVAKKEVAPTVKADDGGDFAVKAINNQVRDFAIDGFHGGSSKLSKSEDLENMKKIVALVKPIIDQVPAGYVMQITGHAADYDGTAKQMSVSKARAGKIYNELKKAGVASAKMSYKGVGINEPISGADLKDAKQRSVSFKAVKK
jgi:outer membrane protein OmpA-like peptidoglycan-associated protein